MSEKTVSDMKTQESEEGVNISKAISLLTFATVPVSNLNLVREEELREQLENLQNLDNDARKDTTIVKDALADALRRIDNLEKSQGAVLTQLLRMSKKVKESVKILPLFTFSDHSMKKQRSKRSTGIPTGLGKLQEREYTLLGVPSFTRF